MKRIGICTLHFAKNFGAILQAFALQTTLEDLSYQSNFIMLEELENRQHDEEVSSEQEEKFINSINLLKRSDVLYKDEPYKYDSVVIGSDEIWNLKNPSFKHYKEYFGYNLDADRVISYAPSCNTTDEKTVREYFENEIGEKANFDKFTNLSVRDTNTKNLIANIKGEEPTVVVDPTLLIKNYKKYTKETIEKDYILIYGYVFSEKEKEKIKELSKETGLPIYAIGFKMDWVDKNIAADIFEFLGYVKNATYVISNSFHGVVFSIIFEKQFIAFSNGAHKIQDILERFGLMEKDCTNLESIIDVACEKIDYEKVNGIRNINVEKSLEYLKNAIEN